MRTLLGNMSKSGWAPYYGSILPSSLDGPYGNTYLGVTDSSFLFTYAVFMYLRYGVILMLVFACGSGRVEVSVHVMYM